MRYSTLFAFFSQFNSRSAIGPAFSGPTFSTSAFWILHFPVLHFHSTQGGGGAGSALELMHVRMYIILWRCCYISYAAVILSANEFIIYELTLVQITVRYAAVLFVLASQCYVEDNRVRQSCYFRCSQCTKV